MRKLGNTSRKVPTISQKIAHREIADVGTRAKAGQLEVLVIRRIEVRLVELIGNQGTEHRPAHLSQQICWNGIPRYFVGDRICKCHGGVSNALRYRVPRKTPQRKPPCPKPM